MVPSPRETRTDRNGRRHLLAGLPLLVFAVGALAIILLWRDVNSTAQRCLCREAQITASQVALRLEAWIDARTIMIRHLAEGHFVNTDAIEREFVTEAALVVNLDPGFQAFNFVGPDRVIRIVYPEASNLAALHKNLDSHPSPGVREAIALAERSGRIARTPVIDLLQGGRGMASYQILRDRSGEPLGFLNAVFRLDTLVDTCLAEDELRSRFSFDLHDENGRLAYAHQTGNDTADSPLAAEVPVRVMDGTWQLRLAPNAEYARRGKTLADEALAGGGLLLVTALAVLLHVLLRRQDALQESRARYQLLVENMRDLVVKIDTQGRFLYVSPSTCEVAGKSESELLGHEFMPLVHEDDRAATEEAIKNLYRPPHHAYLEHRALTEHGGRWYAWSGTAVLGEDGNVTAIMGVGRDITRRRELEDQLLQSQKLQAIGQLAGGIAHDYNNILQAIQGHVELLLEDLGDDPTARKDLESIQRSVHRAVELTSQLLAFSRRQELTLTVFDLRSATTDVQPMLQRLLGDEVELRLEAGADELLVEADRGQLKQVILDLCVNAHDAAAGTITITTSTRNLDADFCREHRDLEPGRYVVLEVADTGAGIPADLQVRIFEPFFTTRDVGAGTGLGLATVHGIVNQHGGLIQMTSEEGRGSCFTVLLPAAKT